MQYLLILLIAIILPVGCATLPLERNAATAGSYGDRSAPQTAAGSVGYSEHHEVARLQHSLVTAGYSMVGARRLVVDGTRYNSDCSGTILAVYHRAGINLSRKFAEKAGNGVRRLAALADDANPHRGAVLPATPAPGDIVFWDNTYDRNGNGRADDPLTHAGIVLAVDANGTIDYLHYHYRRGIVVERMNLSTPDDPTTNAAMRKRGSPGAVNRYLSGQLFRTVGSPYLLASATSDS